MKSLKILNILFLTFFIQSVYAQEAMKLEHFDQIYATGIIEITLQKGEEEKIVLVTNNFDRDDVKVRVSEEELRISVTKSLIKDALVKIVVTYKELRRIKVNAGAYISAKNPITIDKLDLRAMSGSQLELELDVNKLHVKVAEGAQIHLTGKTKSLNVTAASGAEFDGFELESDDTFASANTGGRAEVVANKSIEAVANTGGRVRYKGDPEKVQLKDYLGGEVDVY
jgi:Putative auto-transporter adhesin, head GIN domain